MKERIKGFLDKYLNKFISRKLFVFIVGTVLLCTGLINAEIWLTLSSFYITAEGVKDWTVANNTSKSTTTVTTNTDKANSSISVTKGGTTGTPPTEPLDVKVINTEPISVETEDGTYGRQG